MDDRVDVVGAKDPIDGDAVRGVAFDNVEPGTGERAERVDDASLGIRKVVENHHVPVGGMQRNDAMASHISGPAGHECGHRALMHFTRCGI